MIQQETLELLEWARLCQQLSTFASTKLGKIAASHLPIPTTQSESQQLLTQTTEAYQLETTILNGLSFEGIEDIGDALERAELQGTLTGLELYHLATTLAGVRKLRRTLDSQEDIPTLQELIADVRTYPELEQEIYHCIDERGDVTDRSSDKLAGIRQQLKAQRDRIYQILQNLIQRQGNAISQPVISQRGDRFVIPVKATHKDTIPGVVHDTSGSGSTLYVEPQSIVNLGNQLRQYQRQEQVISDAVRAALSAKVTEVKEDLEKMLAIVITIDLATAKARYSLWLEANPPRFIDTGEKITLRKLRHPLLIWQQRYEEGHPVVPIDLLIEPQTRVVTITGPNTGGKTVTLKTMAIAALMAKIGMFVPAQAPVELPWFDQILADIGDEQSLQQSLSTFSGHIRRISRIINALAENATSALILLDEVGAGTDPAEGSALAQALLQYLADHSQLTIATTHYGELKALKYADSRFENASVEFNDETLSPTYRLLWGIPGRSNALTIAKRLGLDEAIVTLAQSKVGDSATIEINQVISGLEDQRRQQEAKAKEAAQLLAKAERFYQEVAQKAANLQQREKELKVSQELAIQTAINEAKGEIATVIKRLQKGPQTAQAAGRATQAINQISENHKPETPPPPVGFKPAIGDRIRIPKLGQTAEVLSFDEEQGNLIVKFGIMKMTVTLADIESLQGEKPVIPTKKTTEKSNNDIRRGFKPNVEEDKPKQTIAVRTDRNTLDIRGFKVADAEIAIERSIDKAHAMGTLWIIHGKGTGKLRQGVHDYLSKHSLFTRFETAPENEGGGGVTIAYLK